VENAVLCAEKLRPSAPADEHGGGMGCARALPKRAACVIGSGVPWGAGVGADSDVVTQIVL